MKFLNPKELTEALEMKAANPAYKILAGGTDLCVLMNGDIEKPDGVINIFGIDQLKEIKEEKKSVTIGSLATHTAVINNEIIKKYYQILIDACKTIGARQIQNRGTIGGNVANASPAGDTMPALLVYNAEVVVKGKKGERAIPLEKFYNGYKNIDLANDEIITAFKLPLVKTGERILFTKIGTRQAQAISKVVAAFRMKVSNELVSRIQIAYGSVAPVPIRLTKTEEFLTGKPLSAEVAESAVKIAAAEIAPIDDIRSTAAYRVHAAAVILKRFLIDK